MKSVMIATLSSAMVSLAVGAQNIQPSRRASTGAASQTPTELSVESQTQLVAQYCAGCHSNTLKSGGLTLAGFDASTVTQNAEVAEKVIRKLRAGLMPPPNVRRPDPTTIKALIDALETKIDTAAALNPNPGWHPFARLNRAEYGRAVRDLLGLDVDVSAYLPADTISGGFDNVSDVQTFSATLFEGYLRAASEVSRLAVGSRHASATTATYKVGPTVSQMSYVDGAPMGTRGGISVVHVFPSDGEYTIRVTLVPNGVGGTVIGRETMGARRIDEQIDVSVNGERLALLDVNPRANDTDEHMLDITTPPIHIKAGPQRLSAAFIQRIDGPVDDLLVPLGNTLADNFVTYGVTVLPHMRSMTILGPSHVSGVSDSVSRQKLFTCRPRNANEEQPCTTAIVKRLTSQAYRGAATDEDIQNAMKFYRQGREKGDFENGIRLALRSILVSPRFLFRLEEAPRNLAADQTYRVSDQDMASRLSFFLWSTLPDTNLIKAANQGELRTPLGRQKQVKRMLADPRAQALSVRFAGQWLRLQDLEKTEPDPLLFPQYNNQLARAMKRETEMFFDSIVREDRNVLDLLTADYTFVNEILARHYGIPNVAGSSYRRVQLPENRRGLLGQGSILTLTSFPDRTSPVLRGKWVMEVLFGTPPPPPPPNVPALDDSVKATQGGKRLTTRERVEEHRKSPACSSCHRVMDPLGLSLENFDATGAWRIKDNEAPVDSVGELYDGTRMEGPAGVRQGILNHSDIVLRNFTERLMTYALGRRVEDADMPTVRAIVRDAAENDNRISSFILGVVNSVAFQMAKPEHAELTSEAHSR